MSIETLIKKYEEELPKRWTREGNRILSSDFDNALLQASRLLWKKEEQRIREQGRKSFAAFRAVAGVNKEE